MRQARLGPQGGLLSYHQHLPSIDKNLEGRAIFKGILKWPSGGSRYGMVYPSFLNSTILGGKLALSTYSNHGQGQTPLIEDTIAHIMTPGQTYATACPSLKLDLHTLVFPVPLPNQLSLRAAFSPLCPT